jgi:hypothetical protein
MRVGWEDFRLSNFIGKMNTKKYLYSRRGGDADNNLLGTMMRMRMMMIRCVLLLPPPLRAL